MTDDKKMTSNADIHFGDLDGVSPDEYDERIEDYSNGKDYSIDPKVDEYYSREGDQLGLINWISDDNKEFLSIADIYNLFKRAYDSNDKDDPALTIRHHFVDASPFITSTRIYVNETATYPYRIVHNIGDNTDKNLLRTNKIEHTGYTNLNTLINKKDGEIFLRNLFCTNDDNKKVKEVLKFMSGVDSIDQIVFRFPFMLDSIDSAVTIKSDEYFLISLCDKTTKDGHTAVAEYKRSEEDNPDDDDYDPPF